MLIARLARNMRKYAQLHGWCLCFVYLVDIWVSNAPPGFTLASSKDTLWDLWDMTASIIKTLLYPLVLKDASKSVSAFLYVSVKSIGDASFLFTLCHFIPCPCKFTVRQKTMLIRMLILSYSLRMRRNQNRQSLAGRRGQGWQQVLKRTNPWTSQDARHIRHKCQLWFEYVYFCT